MQTRSLAGHDYSKWQLIMLVTVRVLIGWHFLYEGVIKILNPSWSSAAYLMDSAGWFSGLFKSMAGNPDLMKVVDFLNIWGLAAIGLGLILGFFSRYAIIAGIVILSFYYLSHPPFINAGYAIPSEGNYLIVNKTLIEMFTLWLLLLFPTSKYIGIDRLIFNSEK